MIALCFLLLQYCYNYILFTLHFASIFSRLFLKAICLPDCLAQYWTVLREALALSKQLRISEQIQAVIIVDALQREENPVTIMG